MVSRWDLPFDVPFYALLRRFVLVLAVAAGVVYWLTARGWQLRDRIGALQEGDQLNISILGLEGARKSGFLRGVAVVFLLAFAFRYFLGRYEMVWNDHSFMVGVDYVDQKIALPLQWLVIAASIIAGVLVAVGGSGVVMSCAWHRYVLLSATRRGSAGSCRHGSRASIGRSGSSAAPARPRPGRSPCEREARVSDAVLDVREIRLEFGGLVALDGASFRVAAGEMHGIIGPNGAGKTTMFDVVTGVYRPLKGSVLLDGQDITGWSPHRRTRSGLGRSFQTVGLAPGLTARDNVLATVEAIERVKAVIQSRRAARRRRAEVDELLGFFGLDDVADTQVTDLPLGTTKLLELAKVFAGHPKVVLLDEPFAGLSASEAKPRVELIAKRRAEANAAVVIVEHDVLLLLESCDRLTVLDYGVVVAQGDPHEVMASAEVRAAYMGEVVEGAG